VIVLKRGLLVSALSDGSALRWLDSLENSKGGK